VSSSPSWSCLVDINAPVGHGGRLSLNCFISLTLTWMDFESLDVGDVGDSGDGWDGWDDGNLFSFVEITITNLHGTWTFCLKNSVHVFIVMLSVIILHYYLLLQGLQSVDHDESAKRAWCIAMHDGFHVIIWCRSRDALRCITLNGNFHRWYVMFVT